MRVLLVLLVLLCALVLPSDLMAQQTITTCRGREDGKFGRECFERPYDRRDHQRFLREERRWDEQHDERRVQEEIEWDRRDRERRR